MLKKFLILFCVAFIGACSSFNGDGLSNGSYSQGKRLDPNCDHYAVGGSGGGCTPAGQWHLKDKQGQRVPFQLLKMIVEWAFNYLGRLKFGFQTAFFKRRKGIR